MVNSSKKKVKGFAIDPLFLFAGVFIVLVSVIMALQISDMFSTHSVGLPGQEHSQNFSQHFKELDWFIPFFVGSCCVAMILYGTMAGGVPISIVLFSIIILITSIVVVHINDFTLFFFDFSNTITPLNMPLTRFTLEWMPVIIVLTNVLLGILMHTRTSY